jgi:hypothetical protein
MARLEIVYQDQLLVDVNATELSVQWDGDKVTLSATYSVAHNDGASGGSTGPAEDPLAILGEAPPGWEGP